MNVPENGDAAQALRLAQLEIKMLREQLLRAIDEAQAARDQAKQLARSQAAPPAPPAPPEVLPSPTAKSGNGNVTEMPKPGERRVLCVEDSEANFRLIETILGDRPGTHLVWAESGRKGVELAALHEPGLVLLDLDLPDMHGSEVLGKLRAEPRTAQTPVIVISADATPSQIERMLAAGASDYITKPFEIRRFLLMFDEIFPVKN